MRCSQGWEVDKRTSGRQSARDAFEAKQKPSVDVLGLQLRARRAATHLGHANEAEQDVEHGLLERGVDECAAVRRRNRVGFRRRSEEHLDVLVRRVGVCEARPRHATKELKEPRGRAEERAGAQTARAGRLKRHAPLRAGLAHRGAHGDRRKEGHDEMGDLARADVGVQHAPLRRWIRGSRSRAWAQQEDAGAVGQSMAGPDRDGLAGAPAGAQQER